MRYKTGDIVLTNDGKGERKILGVCDLVIFVSSINDFEMSGGSFTEAELGRHHTLKKKKWQPELGEVYWFVSHFGDTAAQTFANDRFDKYRISIGNCFETQDEAMEELTKIKEAANNK